MIDQSIILILPLIAAIGTAIAVLVIDLIVPGRQNLAVVVALIGLSVVSVATLYANQTPGEAYGGD
jgi:NADH:ubiquinone oxidoreductase subunit 2 (subunit N)